MNLYYGKERRPMSNKRSGRSRRMGQEPITENTLQG
jgi:hypothetical protein